MKKLHVLWVLGLLSLIGSATASGLILLEAFPNTSDDVNLEYIELFNPSCEIFSLSGVSIRDASAKVYQFQSGEIAPGGTRRVFRTESKITLNNVDETLELLDLNGEVIHSVEYVVSTKDVPIRFATYLPPSCIEEVPIEQDTELDAVTPELILVQTGSVLPDAGEFTATGLIEAGEDDEDLIEGEGVLNPEGDTNDGPDDPMIEEPPPETTTTENIISEEDTTPTDGDTTTVLSGSSMTGSIASDLPVTTGFSGSVITAQKLILDDIDKNGKLDRIEVLYSAMLTGTLDTKNLVISSATGGLATFKIETSSGVVRELSISGSVLIIDLIEQNLSHLDLKINATSGSHLRLKTLTGFGLIGLQGEAVEGLLLTQSFDGYASSKIENRAYTPPSFQSPVAPYQSALNTSIFAVPTRNLPNPVITIQSGVLPSGQCSGVTCRVNVIHTTVESFEECAWTIQPTTGTTWWHNGCNPSAFTLGTQGGLIQLQLKDRDGIAAERFSELRVAGYIALSEASLPEGEMLTPVHKTINQTSKKSSINVGNAPKKVVSKTPTKVKETQKKPSTKKATAVKAVKPPKKTTAAKPSVKKAAAKTPTKKAVKKPATKKPATKKTQTQSGSTKIVRETNSKSQTQSSQVDMVAQGVTSGVVGLACAAIGFGLAWRRKRTDEE